MIFASPGTYNEAVTITVPQTLQCSFPAAVSIPGVVSTPPLTLNTPRCIIAQTVISSGTGAFAPNPVTISANNVQVIGFEVTGGVYGIATTNGQNHTCVLYNYVHAVAGNGLSFNCGDYSFAYGNIVTNNSKWATWCGAGMSVYSPVASDSNAGYHIWISHNLSYSNNNYSSCGDGEGLILDTFDASQHACGTTPYQKYALAASNVFYNNAGTAIKVYHDGAGGKIALRDNTSYFDLAPNFDCDSCNGSPAQEVWANNIGLQSTTSGAFSTTGVTTLDNNLSLCYSSGTPQTGSACGLTSGNGNQLGVDPLFQSVSTDDFHLGVGSPALGAGNTTLGLPATYLDGVVPPNPIDIGALGHH